MDRLSELPKDILQRILYFLSQHDAVRTSILSKSWRYIWCTRPNLHLSDHNFEAQKQNFPSVVDKTLQLYCDQRLCLEEFHLSISLLGKDNSDEESVLLLEKWIPILTTMGVTEFRLSIRSRNIDLPSVVFKAESLTHLYLNQLNLGRNTRVEKMPFARLQELRLSNMNFIMEEIFDRIISSCPLLTTMSLQDCKGLRTIKLEKKVHNYLKHFTSISFIRHTTDKCIIKIDAPTLETIKILGGKIRFHSHKFNNLKSLSLMKVQILANSFDNSLCYHFPNLRVLTIARCFGFPQFELHIDAPNIILFKFVGQLVPSISFTPTSRDWRTDLNLVIPDNLDDVPSWFLKLNGLLRALSQSQISLSMYQNRRNNQEEIQVQGMINGDNKPVVVEQLQLDCYLCSFPSFLNGLFCICRPRYIAHHTYGSQFGHCHKEREQSELTESNDNIRKWKPRT